MKRPPDRWFVRSLRRFTSPAVLWLSIVIAIAGIFCSPAAAQFSSPNNNSTRSISGQFIVTRPDSPVVPAGSRRFAGDTNLVRLEPALLAVSAERIKELLWHRLEIRGQWRGQIYLALHPARSTNENVTITVQHVGRGWNYRVELPDVLTPTRFARALTGVVLLEFANRNAADRSAEIPGWLTEGLSQQLLAAGSPEFVLSTPDKIVNGLPVTRLQQTRQGMDPLAAARRVLKNHRALTFEELSWPAGDQLAGGDEGVYRASAQLFVNSVLQLNNGPAHLRAMLESLPRFLNWQLAFRWAFAGEFPRPLDVEKWWALTVVNFAAHDPGPGWTLAVSREKLDGILRVPVEIRTATNRVPERAEISLQSAIRSLEPERRTAILQTMLRDLDLAQLRVARPYAGLTAEYGRVIRSYLGERPPTHQQTGRMAAAPAKAGTDATIKKLDALDARRREIGATARPAPSVQPSRAPLKF